MNQDQLEMQRDRFKLLSGLEVLGGSLAGLARARNTLRGLKP